MKKTVLITGCSSGIGHAAAKLFAKSGWNVIATLRAPEAELELGKLDNLLVTRLDVRDRKSIAQALDAGLARFGQIDALINNAGFSLFGVLESLTREQIQEQFDVNVLGVIDLTRAILPHFRRNRAGLVLNVSSRGGLVPLPMISLYCASKHALEAFSESIYYELASLDIAVKLVEPSGGVTDTRFSKRMVSDATVPAPADYAPFVSRTHAFFAGLRARRMVSSEEVAQVIYGAATDGTAQLRYFVGEDVGGLLEAKRKLSDQEYLDRMRARFSPAPR